jgi:2-keto-4-pentenoate hydratase/2-oxohepta-3-ene-1,7-dioic acid hydratase in catechol pathway
VKIARFSTDGSDPRYGVLDGDEYVVLAGDPMFAGFETLDERIPVDEVRLLAPVIPRSKVVGVVEDPDDEDAEPTIFLKPNTAVVGPGDAIQVADGMGSVEANGTLVIVIGSVAKRVRAEDYAQVVFGYTIGNDVTAVDLMQADGQWARAKGYDSFAPIGPLIETELDPTIAVVETEVDGGGSRSGSIEALRYGIPQIVELVSDIWTLLPGDLIMVTVAGGGIEIGDGSTVSIAVDGVGVLENPVRTRA